MQDLPPIFYLKPSLKYSAAHDEFVEVYCEYIGKFFIYYLQKNFHQESDVYNMNLLYYKEPM